MSTIKVLTNIEAESDVQQLSTEEREIVFNSLADENPSIPRQMFEQFLIAFNEELDNKLQAEMPELSELLLKHIINMSCNVTNSRVNSTTVNRPNTILPIVSSLIRGGANFPQIQRSHVNKQATARLPAGKNTTADNVVRISFDRTILISDERGRVFNTAPGDVISVIGIRSSESRDVYYRDTTYKNVRGLLPIGAYRAEDIFDSANANTLLTQVFSQELPPRIKFMFQGDPKVQLSQVFNNLVRRIYMPMSFGQYAYTLINVTTPDIPTNPSTEGVSSRVDKFSPEFTITQLAQLLFPLHNPPRKDIAAVLPSTDPILQLLNSLNVGAFPDKFRLSITTNVYGRGLSSIYNGALIDGVDASKVRSQLVLYNANKARKTFDSKVKIEKADKEIINATFRNIVLTKLGKKRADEIQFSAKDDPLTFQTEGILPFLKPAERKLIEIEYQKQLDYNKSVIGNKCPHVSIYKRLRRSIDTATSIKLLYDLRKYYVTSNNKSRAGSKDGNEMIKCNNCGFNIICPHYDEYVSLTAASDRAVKMKIAKYVSNVQDRDTFCKICGEVLSNIDALEGTTDEIPEAMDEELRNFIWSEIAVNMKFFRFGPMIEVSKLISRVRDGIYTYIFNVEKQILRSKTATADEIKARKRLFVSIYSFAYMVHLIMSNLGKDIVMLQNFKINDPKKAIPELIKRSLELILVSRSVTLKEIPGISIDIVRNSLVTAYKEISQEGQAQISTERVEDRQVELDPVLTTIINMKVLDAIVRSQRFNRENINSSVQNKVLENFSKKSRATLNSIFAEVLTSLNWRVDNFTNLIRDSANVSGNNKSRKEITHCEIVADAWSGYIAKSYNVIAQYVKDKLFDYYAADSPEAYNNGIKELESALAEIRIGESELLRHKSMCYPHVFSALTQYEHKFSHPEASIARIYDEDGRAHVWNIYVYEANEEYRVADLAKIVTGGKRFDRRPSDKKCSVCGVLKSQIDELDVEKIKDSLRSVAMLDSFFRFYETRCPKGDLHIYADNISKCTKCGIALGTNAITQGSLNIFRQYKASYLRDRNEINISVIQPEATVVVKNPSLYAEEYSKFTQNFSAVTSLAEKFGLNQKLLLALGATEKVEYNDILTGKYIPREVEERNAPRIYSLDAYLRSLHIEWNQLRIYYRFQKQGSDIYKLIEESGIPRHEISSIIATLPDIYDDYSARFNYVRKHLKPRDIVAFCIQTVCEKILNIHAIDGPASKLAKSFAEYIIKKFLRNDELVSKPGYFSWSDVFGDKESKRDLVDTDAEPSTEVQIDTTDDLNEAAMSLEAFDVEEDPDAEPDDDPANQVRVGENYGL